MEFTPEVINEIGYYVYRLVDPRDGNTFYVGKGKGNRVFAHAKAALANYEGKNYLDKDEEEINLKYDRIHSIINDGLEPINIIHKYGLTSDEAFLVESALIDAYDVNILTNKVRGKDTSKGPINAITLQENLELKEYVERPGFPDYVIIKISMYWRNERGSIYEAVSHSWKMGLRRAKQYKFVIAAEKGTGKVLGVYKVNEWYRCEDSDRIGFHGEEAPYDIKQLFMHHRIPAKYTKKGASNPIQYSKFEF